MLAHKLSGQKDIFLEVSDVKVSNGGRKPFQGPGVLGQDVRHTNVVYAHMMYHAHNAYQQCKVCEAVGRDRSSTAQAHHIFGQIPRRRSLGCKFPGCFFINPCNPEATEAAILLKARAQLGRKCENAHCNSLHDLGIGPSVCGCDLLIFTQKHGVNAPCSGNTTPWPVLHPWQ